MNKLLILIYILFFTLSLSATENAGYAYLTKVLDSQEISLRFSAEDCSLDPKNPFLPKGLHDGDQVRVYRHDNKDFVLFTVRFKDEGEFGREIIRMTEIGMSRLDYKLAEGQKLKLTLPVILNNLTEKEAKDTGELYEFIEYNGTNVDNADFLLVLTPHGGEIEVGTNIIGNRIIASKALKNISIHWGGIGVARPEDTNPISAYNRWHITSTAISENSFPKLGKLISNDRMFEHAIALHGYRGDEILIGGRGSVTIKKLIKKEIENQGVNIPIIVIESSGYLSGFSLSNIVNRYSGNGIQIEFPRIVRVLYAKEISKAIINAYKKIKLMEKNQEFTELEIVDTLNTIP